MNDRFKFRAYNKELRKMYEVDSICPYEDNHTKGGEVFLKGIQHNSFYFPEEVEVMQCTGLKDKNGKLIYEGDIVKVFHISSTGQPIEIIEEVCFDNKFASFKTRGYDKLSIVYMNRFDDDDVYEVIGNIYENKELLEDNQ